MPLYEYQCTSCSERMEILQGINDPPYSRCPKCGGEMKKLISSPAIQFKGSGFYKTDYASSKPAESKPETTKSDTKKPETKSDSSTTSSTTKSE
jgi:putative FmdB family regulatory protein